MGKIGGGENGDGGQPRPGKKDVVTQQRTYSQAVKTIMEPQVAQKQPRSVGSSGRTSMSETNHTHKLPVSPPPTEPDTTEDEGPPKYDYNGTIMSASATLSIIHDHLQEERPLPEKYKVGEKVEGLTAVARSLRRRTGETIAIGAMVSSDAIKLDVAQETWSPDEMHMASNQSLGIDG